MREKLLLGTAMAVVLAASTAELYTEARASEDSVASIRVTRHLGLPPDHPEPLHLSGYLTLRRDTGGTATSMALVRPSPFHLGGSA